MIDLPPLKTHHTSEYKKLASYSFHFDYGFLQKHSMQVDYAILWVDERSKDYLVVWTSTRNDLVAFCRKGYEEWFKTPGCEYRRQDVDDACEDLAYNYKDEKLYILSYYGRITIWDFSQEFPRIYPNNPLYYHDNLPLLATRLKLTTSGDVLMVRRVCQYDKTIRFKVYKMNSTNGDWEEVDSLEEEEALVWDLSVTLPTKGVSGIKKDSIYYCDYYQGRRPSFRKAITYEIPTQRIEQCSHLPGGVRDARWFLPCFGVGEE